MAVFARRWRASARVCWQHCRKPPAAGQDQARRNMRTRAVARGSGGGKMREGGAERERAAAAKTNRRAGRGRASLQKQGCWCHCAWAVARGGAMRESAQRRAPTRGGRRRQAGQQASCAGAAAFGRGPTEEEASDPVSIALRRGRRARARGGVLERRRARRRAPWASPRRAEGLRVLFGAARRSAMLLVVPLVTRRPERKG